MFFNFRLPFTHGYFVNTSNSQILKFSCILSFQMDVGEYLETYSEYEYGDVKKVDQKRVSDLSLTYNESSQVPTNTRTLLI